MSQLTFSSIPGFTDLPDSVIAADQPLTDDSIQKISANAKFGAVRTEHFYGFYKNGETVQLPTSPVDGYAYARSELRYGWSIYSTRPATGPTNGAAVPPTLGDVQQAGGGLDSLEYFTARVEQKDDTNPGLVSCEAMLNDGTTQTLTNHGVLYVATIAERLGG